ncbi:MAG: polysaccharide lyase 6 family protein [Pacificimonas sp.]
MSGRLLAWTAALCVFAAPATAETFLVRDQEDYVRVLSGVKAGDVITLADGEWRDFEIVITGRGRPGEPITLRPETPGGVVLTGQSSLSIGGAHVIVSDLVFRDGYSPTGDVVSFRNGSDDLANNSRATGIVIDGFSKPDRVETDYWVSLYGRNNRFDHGHLTGKTNRGVTLAVRLDSEASRDNGHRIDHNYFGPRPNLGSNGGETLRIGTSHYAEFVSGTVVENNIFDRCDGEVEIISSKSGGNVLRGNLFLRSRGALTLRHGDGTLVERNVFMGHGKDHTGGIRVINRDQTVRENYMEGLRGTGFASALTVMNGVPDSPANRYVQVSGANISHNTVAQSTRISLGAGADEERSAAPRDSRLAGNLFAGNEGDIFIKVDAGISGITLENNVVASGTVDAGADALPRADVSLERGENGLLYPVSDSFRDVGAPRDLVVIALEDVGVSWYAKPDAAEPFGGGAKTAVGTSSGALATAVAAAGDGDTLQLASGEHIVDRTLIVDKALTLVGSGDNDTVVTFARPSLFELRTGGKLQLRSLVIDGAGAPDSEGNAVIRTGSLPILGNVLIDLDDITVRNLTVNRNFHVIYFGTSTFADRVSIARSRFADVSGSIVSAASEGDDQGRYNVEYLDIENSEFRNIAGPVANVYRGGRDESTFGPHVRVEGSTFENAGAGSGQSLRLHGVQNTDIAGNIFAASAPAQITHTVGTPLTAIRDNVFEATPQPDLVELNHPGPPRVRMSGNRSRDEAQR